MINLKNDTILLRAPEPEDLDFLYEWENDQRLWEAGNTQTPLSRFVLREYLKQAQNDIYQTRQLRLMITLLENPKEPIGAIDLFEFDPYHLRAGIGIILKGDFQGKGLAKQALQLTEEYSLFHLGLHLLFANVTEKNTQSRRLFESAGYVACADKKHWTRIGMEWHNEIMYQKILIKSQD